MDNFSDELNDSLSKSHKNKKGLYGIFKKQPFLPPGVSKNSPKYKYIPIKYDEQDKLEKIKQIRYRLCIRKRPFLPVGKSASSFNVHFKHETPMWEKILKRRKGILKNKLSLSLKKTSNVTNVNQVGKRSNFLSKHKSTDLLKKKMKLSLKCSLSQSLSKSKSSESSEIYKIGRKSLNSKLLKLQMLKDKNTLKTSQLLNNKNVKKLQFLEKNEMPKLNVDVENLIAKKDIDIKKQFKLKSLDILKNKKVKNNLEIDIKPKNQLLNNVYDKEENKKSKLEGLDLLKHGKKSGSNFYQRLANSKLIKPSTSTSSKTSTNNVLNSNFNKCVMSTPAILNTNKVDIQFAALNDLGSAISTKNIRKSNVALNLKQISNKDDLKKSPNKQNSLLDIKSSNKSLNDNILVDQSRVQTPNNSRYNLRERKNTPNYSDLEKNRFSITQNSKKNMDLYHQKFSNENHNLFSSTIEQDYDNNSENFSNSKLKSNNKNLNNSNYFKNNTKKENNSLFENTKINEINEINKITKINKTNLESDGSSWFYPPSPMDDVVNKRKSQHRF